MLANAWWFKVLVAAFAIAVATLLMGGCPTTQVAEHGMAMRGPLKADVAFGDGDEVKSISGEYGGGTGSMLHVERETRYENGNLKSHFLATSDPTQVQKVYFEGVRGQSTADAQNFGLYMSTITTAVQNVAAIATQTMAEVRTIRQETATEREDRLAREAKRDERLDKLIGILERQLPAPPQ